MKTKRRKEKEVKEKTKEDSKAGDQSSNAIIS